MANYTKRTLELENLHGVYDFGGLGGGAGSPRQNTRVFVLDFPEINAGRIQAGSPALALNDTIELCDLDKSTLVTSVVARLETAEGAAATVDIGDENDPDRFLDGLNINGAVNSYNGPVSANVPLVYNADSHLRVQLKTGRAPTTAVLLVAVFSVDMALHAPTDTAVV